MAQNAQRFLVSVGEADEEYGLYVMEKESKHHTNDSLLAYNYDSDNFVYILARDLSLFTTPSELVVCKDEFGNEYKGEKLQARIKEAIQAYEQELPGFVTGAVDYPIRNI